MAIRNLRRNPRRTFLVFATLAVGAAMLFTFRAFNRGVLDEYRDVSIHSRYGHGSILPADYWGRSFEKPWERWLESAEPYGNALRAVPDVQQVFPRLTFSSLITNGSLTFNGVGVAGEGKAEGAFFDRLKLNAGTYLDGTPDGILLGSGLARSLGATVGSTLTLLATTIPGSLNSGVFTVKGIFETGIKALDAVAFRVELGEAQRLLDTAKVESISVALKPGGDWARVKAAVATQPAVVALTFEEMDQTYYQNGVNWLKSQAGVFERIILFIVLLGIFNAVAVTILERGPELATARANGEGRRGIFWGLMLEVSILGGAAAVSGIALVAAIGKTVLAKGVTMPPAPGMTLPSQVYLGLTWSDASAVLGLTWLVVILGAALTAAKVLRGPILAGLRPA